MLGSSTNIFETMPPLASRRLQNQFIRHRAILFRALGGEFLLDEQR
jgi:hypothetical protein